MTSLIELISPKIKPPLEEEFRPAVLVNHNFRSKLKNIGVPLIIGLEKNDGQLSRYETLIYPDDHPEANANDVYVERLLKFILWQRGGYRIYNGGSKKIGQFIANLYSINGERAFDANFFGQQVYEKPFQVILCAPDEVPATRENRKQLGRHLEGNRIGFDLGASDRKVSAVIDGNVVFSEEVMWSPRNQADPNYHYREITAALQKAASYLPSLDAIGGSSAGIYINNRPMVASLYRSVPAERFDEIKNLFLRIRKDFNVPLDVINDGDVTALAGSMSVGENGVLGVAMGSSEATGYVDMQGQITGWLNELAFAPVDYNPNATLDEWSGDRGCGASYFSQQCVFRLAPKAGIEIPGDLLDAEKLKFVQDLLEEGHEGAVKIWKSIGVFLGYGLAHYADFYEMRHVLILGRVTSGIGGDLLIKGIRQVFEAEFPHLLDQFTVHLPDEKTRRIGQSVAAASLTALE